MWVLDRLAPLKCRPRFVTSNVLHNRRSVSGQSRRIYHHLIDAGFVENSNRYGRRCMLAHSCGSRGGLVTARRLRCPEDSGTQRGRRERLAVRFAVPSGEETATGGTGLNGGARSGVERALCSSSRRLRSRRRSTSFGWRRRRLATPEKLWRARPSAGWESAALARLSRRWRAQDAPDRCYVLACREAVPSSGRRWARGRRLCTLWP
jgi:hypothetical protein